VLTDTVYKRQKHPFTSPPATMQTEGRLYTLLQDTLRSSVLDGPGIYDRAKVKRLLDAVPSMDGPARSRTDTLLMWMTSLCLLQESFAMGAWS
jgi:asparagine synthase (glutamine-hydrolysing)